MIRVHDVMSTAVLLLLVSAQVAAAGAQQDSTPAAADSARGFYAGITPLPLTLIANFGALRRDRQEDPSWRPARIVLADSVGAADTVNVRVRPRGIWRRRNCQMPPLRVDLPRAALAHTTLAGLDRPKLVQFCHDQARGEQYVLQELQLYRIYALLTPFAHRARLVRVAYVDSGSTKVRTTRYAFLLEEPKALAERLGATELQIKGSVADDLDARTRAIVGVFQYMIGNADWSTGGLHNVELFSRGGVTYPVPYDFDYSGAVDAHYAVPPPQLPIRSVRSRIFRGHCADATVFAEVFATFRSRRQAMHALFRDEVGQLIDPPVAQRMLRYLDDFFAVIDDPEKARREILTRCAVSQ